MRQIRDSVFAAGIFAVLASSAALAQAPDHRTIFTFNQAVTVPGKVLPAGTYEFVTADISDRQVVQIFESGGSKLLATIFAVPIVRPDRPETTQVRFLETPPDTAPALQSWWNAGSTTGYELVYSTEQARLLAKTNPRGVMSAASDKSETVRTVAPALDEAPMPPAPVAVSPAVATPISLTTAPRIPRRTSLPKTAGSDDMWPVAGFFLLLAAGIFTAARRARQGV